MKRIFRIAAITAAALMLLTACLFEDTQVSFIELAADGWKSPGGTVMDTTTMLTLIFDRDIDGFSAADIKLSAGNTGAEKGTLTRIRMGEYNMTVTGINESGTITVSVAKSGYNITNRQKTVDVYYFTLQLPPSTYPAAFIGLTADTSQMEATTEMLILTFNRDIGSQSNGLSAADITFNAGTTGAVNGTLSKGWNTGVYELSLSGINSSGTVTVSVAQTVSLGNSSYYIVDRIQTANVYKYDPSAIPVTFNGLTADGSAANTSTKLTLNFSDDITGLSAMDVTFNPGTTGAVKGALTKTGGIERGVYELSLSGITAGGQVTVSVAKLGYNIAGAPQTTNVYQYTPPVTTPVSFSGLTADGSATAATTKLTLTFNSDISGLSAADITLNPGTTGATKGALTRTGTGKYDLSLSGITASGTVTVSVAKSGYTISGGPRTVNVYLYTPPENKFVKKVTFTSSTATVNFTGLNKNDIYLVKVNTSDLVVSAGSTGGASASISGNQSISGNVLPLLGEELPRKGHPGADEFSANPLPIVKETPGAQRSAFVPLASFSVGAAKSFWVEDYYNSRNFVQKQATLIAAGTYGNIWVMNENTSTGSSNNKITTAEAQALADKFDQIYPLETKLIGYEYGGDPSRPDQLGGKDKDPKVQILIYDIVGQSGNVMAAGYFWSKDFYTNAQLGSSYKSNEAEIFYIDASQVKTVPVYIQSALVHEFQHMINFNEKSVQRNVSSASWYNEMLSMMTEDVIGPMIGIPLTNSYHTIKVRMATALYYYHLEGITEWGTLSSRSYATKIAFGAYLMRNFGGAELLQKILKNNLVNAASVTAALNEISPGMTFDQALSRYGEAMIFSGYQKPSDVLSFDNTVTKTISGTSYTVTGFDVWKDFTVKGPTVLDLSPIEMRPYSITIHSADEWKNRSGNVSITLQRPSNSNVTFYLIAK